MVGAPDAAELATAIDCHSLLIDRPTSDMVPFFHEGNDYHLMLSAEKLVLPAPFWRLPLRYAAGLFEKLSATPAAPLPRKAAALEQPGPTN